MVEGEDGGEELRDAEFYYRGVRGLYHKAESLRGELHEKVENLKWIFEDFSDVFHTGLQMDKRVADRVMGWADAYRGLDDGEARVRHLKGLYKQLNSMTKTYEKGLESLDKLDRLQNHESIKRFREVKGLADRAGYRKERELKEYLKQLVEWYVYGVPD